MGHLSADGSPDSDVVRVVLVVSVAIVLAAMVGTAVLDLGGVGRQPVAEPAIAVNAETNTIRVTFAAGKETGTTMTVEVFAVSTGEQLPKSPATLSAVGESVTFEVVDGTYRVRVVAETTVGRTTLLRQFRVTL